MRPCFPTQVYQHADPRCWKAAIEGSINSSAAGESKNPFIQSIKANLTTRLSDAGMRQRQTKLLYPNHRSPPWLPEAATPRSLEPGVRLPRGARPEADLKQR